jgi:hypothetical protein
MKTSIARWAHALWRRERRDVEVEVSEKTAVPARKRHPSCSCSYAGLFRAHRGRLDQRVKLVVHGDLKMSKALQL